MSTLALIGLGSNLGDRKAHLDSAIAALGGTPGIEVRAVSSYHETPPVGGPSSQPTYLNAAAALETILEPLDLLHAMQRIETNEGRERSVRWGERTLDIDLLLYGNRVIETPETQNRVFGGSTVELRVPHPRMSVRRFVLAPLAEVAPHAVDPLTARTVASLLANLDRRPSYLAISYPSTSGPDRWFVPPEDAASERPDPLIDRLLRALPSVGVAWTPSNPRMPELSPQVDAEQRFSAWLEPITEQLRAQHWTRDRLGDRWLVSDFWFDDLCATAAEHHEMVSAPPFVRYGFDWQAFEQIFLKHRAQVIAPTFVVAIGRNRSSLRSGAFPDRKHWFAPLGDVPVLEIRATRTEVDNAVSEILAACAATRADSAH